jgi:hypothetical protein
MEPIGNVDATGGIAERLGAFLRTLPIATCIKILDALERAALAGDRVPGADLIASELAAIISSRRRRRPRASSPQRQFFALLEPFLIDESLGEKHLARIERASLPPIWTWLARDLAPDAMAAYERDVVDAVIGAEPETARSLAARIHKTLVPMIRAAVRTPGDEAARRRLCAQIGGGRIVEDLADILWVFEHGDALKALAGRIVGPIRLVDDQQASLILAALASFARGRATLLPHAVAVAMTKLAHPWQMVRVAALGAESHEVARIVSTPFAAVIDILLADLEHLMLRVKAAREGHDIERMAGAAKDFAALVRALVTDLELAPDLAQAKHVAIMRSRMAQLLRPEIETLPGRVRRVLASRPPRKAGRPESLDETELASIELGLDILVVAKSHAAELALNEVTLRVFSDLQSFLDASVNPLIDGMRGMAGEERVFRLQQLDAAVKVCHRVLGADFATLLSKAVEVAAGDRRPVTKSA